MGKVERRTCGVELRDRDEDGSIRKVQAPVRDTQDLALSEEQVCGTMEGDHPWAGWCAAEPVVAADRRSPCPSLGGSAWFQQCDPVHPGE